MPKIVLGAGNGQVMFNIPVVPKKGDEITVGGPQIVAVASDIGRELAGKTIRLTSKTTMKVDGKSVPWFGFEMAKQCHSTPGKAL